MDNFWQALYDQIESINKVVNDFVWGPPMLVLLLCTGIYMTVRTNFFQVTKFGYTMKSTLLAIFTNKKVTKTDDKHNISQFQALATALAATIGTGNIVGVATAIASGGPGAVFWMWVSAFFGMMTNYSENVLGIFYRHKNKKGEYIGGPMIYLEKGLKLKWLAVIFSVFCLVASFGIGNIAQVNGISHSIQQTFHLEGAVASLLTGMGMDSAAAAQAASYLPGLLVGIVVAAFVGIVIIGGLKRIASVTEKLVPFMAIFYIIGSLIVICCNIQNVPAAFGRIFEGAFSLRSVGGGVMGYVMAQAIRYGLARGVFSNEAGLGSSVMVHSNSNVKEPVVQGMWGIFEVFFDTIVVCTLTALTILSTNADLVEGLEGVNVTIYAFKSVLGDVGGYIVTFGMLLFAFSTILGWSIYGTRAIQYLTRNSKRPALYETIYKSIFTVVVIIGAMSSVQLVWDLSDTFNGLMALPNLIGVLFLSPIVIKVTRNYVDRKFKGSDVKPMQSYHDDEPVLQDK